MKTFPLSFQPNSRQTEKCTFGVLRVWLSGRALTCLTCLKFWVPSQHHENKQTEQENLKAALDFKPEDLDFMSRLSLFIPVYPNKS